jgi:hypothetical protein
MGRHLVALGLGIALFAAPPLFAATHASPGGAVSHGPSGGGHKACPAGWTRKWVCTKWVKSGPPPLGSKCVKHGWKCEPPIK